MESPSLLLGEGLERRKGRVAAQETSRVSLIF